MRLLRVARRLPHASLGKGPAKMVTQEQVDHWLAHGGVEELKRAMRQAEAAAKSLREACRVDYASLSQPMTI